MSNDFRVKLSAFIANHARKQWVWEQYDSQVMADTVRAPGLGAGIVRVHGTDKMLAFTSDVSPRYVMANPTMGGKQAVAEAYRNLTAVGAKPLATTDNLNFGCTDPAACNYDPDAGIGVDEAEAVRETVAILKQAEMAPLDVTGYGTLEERKAQGHEIEADEIELMQKALDENAVIVAQVTPYFGDSDKD